jgi:hypothetical protein
LKIKMIQAKVVLWIHRGIKALKIKIKAKVLIMINKKVRGNLSKLVLRRLQRK